MPPRPVHLLEHILASFTAPEEAALAVLGGLTLPLSLSLAPLEQGLASGPLNEASQQIVLALVSLSLALGAGLAMELGLGWALGPSWASSLGLVTALWALFWVLTGRTP